MEPENVIPEQADPQLSADRDSTSLGDAPEASVPDEGEVEGDVVIEEVPRIVTIRPIRDTDDEKYVFRFELGPAILHQILLKLESLRPKPLLECLGARHPGFYQIFLDGKAVYIGKTSRTVGDRLKEHKNKLRGKIDYGRLTCRFAYVEDPSLVNISEDFLISFFDLRGEAAWNASGYGSKQTGYRRAGQEASDWQDLFPPDLNLPVTAGDRKRKTLGEIISQIQKQSPVTLSIPKDHRDAFKRDHATKFIRQKATKPFVVWIRWVERQLAAGWQIHRTDTGWYVVPN